MRTTSPAGARVGSAKYKTAWSVLYFVSVLDHNVWPLFVHSDFEGRGIGKTLHATMLAWYVAQTPETRWLGTAPNTRAKGFYRRFGWRDTGRRTNGEIRFELRADEFRRLHSAALPQG